MKKFLNLASTVPELKSHWAVAQMEKSDGRRVPILLGASPNCFSSYLRDERKKSFKLYEEYDWSKMNKICLNGPKVAIHSAELPRKVRQPMKFIFPSHSAANAFFDRCRDVSDHQRRTEEYSKYFGNQPTQLHLSCDTDGTFRKERLIGNPNAHMNNLDGSDLKADGINGLNRWKKANIHALITASSEDLTQLQFTF